VKQQQLRWRNRHREAKRLKDRQRAAAARSRGVDIHRLREPRGLARIAAVLRWRAPLSSNGDWRPLNAWDAVMLYTNVRRLRDRSGAVDREISNDAAAKWLRKQTLV
jgi:hypothetical protein